MNTIDILNLEPNMVSSDLTSYNFLIYGNAGTGKTTFATQLFNDRSLILGTEYGYKGIAGARGVAVADYGSLMAYVNKLDTDEAREKYDTIIVDTTSKLGDIIENYILSMFNKNTLGECKAHGGAYPLVNRYYDMAFNKLKARNYNFVYICHTKFEEIEVLNAEGETKTEKFYSPKMSNRINSLIEAEVDYIFYLTENHTGEKILVTDKTKKCVGKRRSQLPISMPLDAEKFKEEFKKGISATVDEKYITTEKNNTTVVAFQENIRDAESVIIEIVEIGEKLSEQGKGDEARELLNVRLGKDDDNNQRMLKNMKNGNIELLNVILLELKAML